MNKRCNIKRVVSMALSVAILSSSNIKIFALSNDIYGHWAENSIRTWQEKGLIKGYSDGSFKPDNFVTRAEFVRFMNQIFGLDNVGTANFNDVSVNQWFYKDIAIAVQSGYCSGYPDGSFKPNEYVTRAQACVFISKYLGISSNNNSNFLDSYDIPSYAIPYVNALVDSGYISGYEDGTFKPNNPITRAETVFIIDKAYNYGNNTNINTNTNTSINVSDFLIEEEDYRLENTVVEGNLIISENVNNGKVYLDNVEVKGDIIIRGGGRDSIYLKNVIPHKSIVVEKNDVRLEFSGNTTIPIINTKNSCRIASRDFKGVINTVNVLSSSKSNKITLSVPVEKLIVSNSSEVDINRDVKDVIIESNANGSLVNIAEDIKVSKLIANAKSNIEGKGKINIVEVNADKVKISNSVIVDKKVVSDDIDDSDSNNSSSGSLGGTTNGSSGASNSDKKPPTITTSIDTIGSTINANGSITVRFSEVVYLNEGGTERTIGNRVVVSGGNRSNLNSEVAKSIIKVFDTNGETLANDKLDFSVNGNSVIIRAHNSNPLVAPIGKIKIDLSALSSDIRIVDKVGNKLVLEEKYVSGVEFIIGTIVNTTAPGIVITDSNNIVLEGDNLQVLSGESIKLYFDVLPNTKVIYTDDGTVPSLDNGTLSEATASSPILINSKEDGTRLVIKAIAVNSDGTSIPDAEVSQKTITWRSLDKTELENVILEAETLINQITEGNGNIIIATSPHEVPITKQFVTQENLDIYRAFVSRIKASLDELTNQNEIDSAKRSLELAKHNLSITDGRKPVNVSSYKFIRDEEGNITEINNINIEGNKFITTSSDLYNEVKSKLPNKIVISALEGGKDLTYNIIQRNNNIDDWTILPEYQGEIGTYRFKPNYIDTIINTQIVNSELFVPTFNVILDTKQEEKTEITGIRNPENIIIETDRGLVDFEILNNSLLRDETVILTYGENDSREIEARVEWEDSEPTYNGKVNTYTFIGEIIMPEGFKDEIDKLNPTLVVDIRKEQKASQDVIIGIVDYENINKDITIDANVGLDTVEKLIENQYLPSRINFKLRNGKTLEIETNTKESWKVSTNTQQNIEYTGQGNTYYFELADNLLNDYFVEMQTPLKIKIKISKQTSIPAPEFVENSVQLKSSTDSRVELVISNKEDISSLNFKIYDNTGVNEISSLSYDFSEVDGVLTLISPEVINPGLYKIATINDSEVLSKKVNIEILPANIKFRRQNPSERPVIIGEDKIAKWDLREGINRNTKIAVLDENLNDLVGSEVLSAEIVDENDRKVLKLAFDENFVGEKTYTIVTYVGNSYADAIVKNVSGVNISVTSNRY